MRALVCFWACTWLKHRFKYDDSLDVFGVHGIGGLTGTLLAGVFATAAIGGTSGLIEGNPQQVLIQLYGVAVTLVWSGGVTFVLLKLVGVFVPLRVSRSRSWKASIFRSMARRCSRSPPPDTVFLHSLLSTIMSELCHATFWADLTRLWARPNGAGPRNSRQSAKRPAFIIR